ncbi:MAG: hypothetical protein ABSH41_10240 [Syntrophobacteraceae bacterium]
MTFFVKGECQLIVIESLDDQAQVLKTYVKDGKKVASDIHEKGLYPFVRRYYRSNGCNFATDYFDKSGNHSCLKYDKDCTGNTQVFQLSSPVFIPPVPLAYR